MFENTVKSIKSVKYIIVNIWNNISLYYIIDDDKYKMFVHKNESLELFKISFVNKKFNNQSGSLKQTKIKQNLKVYLIDSQAIR